MEKLRLKLSYDFDASLDMLDYLEDTFGVTGIEQASSEQYNEALAHVLSFYSNKKTIREFIAQVVLTSTPVDYNDNFRQPSRDFFTFSVDKPEVYQEW